MRKMISKRLNYIPVEWGVKDKESKITAFVRFTRMDNDYSMYGDDAYATQEQIKRRELFKSKKFWVSEADFKRYFGKKVENDRIKERKKNENYQRDKYFICIKGWCRYWYNERIICCSWSCFLCGIYGVFFGYCKT